MIAWMAYAALVAGVLAMGGLALERLAAATGRPRRIAWMAALALAVAIPVAGGWHGEGPGRADGAPPGAAASGRVVVGDFWRSLPALPVPEGRSAGRIAALAWGAGSLASLAALGGVLVLVCRGRRRWGRARIRSTEVGVSRGFGPALVGIVRPQVVVPAWVLRLEPSARDAIVRHEEEHARARDHLVLLVGGVAAATFPWSPAIWWMYRRLRAAVELDCDQRVLASGIGVARYGDVLISAGARARGLRGFAPAMGQPRTLLERRLKTMSEKQRRLTGSRAAMLVAAAAGAVAVACDAPVPTELRDAMEEVMADQGSETGEDRVGGTLSWSDIFERASASPMIFVDGVRIRGAESVPESLRTKLRRGLEPDAIERIEVLKGPAAAEKYGEEGASGVIWIFTKDGEAVGETHEHIGGALEIHDGARDGGAEPEIVTTPAGSVRVTGQRTAMDEAGDLSHLLSGHVHVTGAQGQDQTVVYVDGVRVDGGLAGLAELSLAPERIDRVEVLRGPAAGEQYGEEGADGVIEIHTKQEGS